MIKHYLLALFLALCVGGALCAASGPASGVCRPASVNVHMTEWGIPLAPCAWCGTTNGVEVHHIYPQHLWPDRAHDTNNMICLCPRCHLVLGHRCNWTNAVTNLVQMIKEGKK